MATAQQVGNSLLKRADYFEKAVNAFVRVLVLEIDKEEILATPVWSGQARSNWTVSLGSPLRLFLGPYAPGVDLGRGETANAAGAMSQALSVIPGRQLGQTVYIENNAPYIGKLNRGVTEFWYFAPSTQRQQPFVDGVSTQSPPGFVSDAVHTAIGMLHGRYVSFVGP